jgi:hypothetical protein
MRSPKSSSTAIAARCPFQPVLVAIAVLATLVCGLRSASPAGANPQQVSIMMDDDQLVYAPDSRRMAVLRSMKALGVDIVRATVLWGAIAHGTSDPRTNSAFDPTNPADYPAGNWVNYDQLVNDAQQVGIGLYFNVTGPGPPWAMGRTRDATLKKSYLPDTAQFGKFVQAVGARYSGSYPNGPGNAGNLPRVSSWSIWNEPNWPGWLAPQNVYSRRLRATLPYAPILYRRLFYSARAGLDGSGHLNDPVMIGETQPLGSPPDNGRTPMRPAEFIRELFCVDGHLRPLRGLAASVRGCDIFHRHGPMRFSDFAHHPYTKNLPPTWTDPSPDAITLGDIGRLPRLLDAIAARTHRLPAKVPIMLTEMGYSTNPPNPFRGVSLGTQSAWINESDYLAYHQPRVYSMTQFEYRDSGPVPTAKKGSLKYWSTFQTGLEFADGRRKPSYAAYALPIWVQRGRGGALELWAQVRFRQQPGPSDRVTFQFRPRGSSRWTSVTRALALTNQQGFVDRRIAAARYLAGGTFRALWQGSVAPYRASSRGVPSP